MRSGVNAKVAVQLVQQHAGSEAWLDGHVDPLQGPRGVYFSLNFVTDKDVVNASPDAAVTRGERLTSRPGRSYKLEGSGKFGTVGV